MDSTNSQIDILVYVALIEEFNYVKKYIGTGFDPDESKDVALTSFLGQIPSKVSDDEFNVILVTAGKMGNTRSSNVVSTFLEKYKPKNVVVIGIAGSLSNDLQPGDVFIPDRINEYLANSATSGDMEWSFQTSGNHFNTTPRLLNRFQMMQNTHKKAFDNWHKHTVKNLKNIDPSVFKALKKSGLSFRLQNKLHAGDDMVLASGPAVGKGIAFANWIRKNVDRKVVAMDMETAGVYDASTIRTPSPRVIAIRGISDFADNRKELIEAAAKEGFRELAIKNAVNLFRTSVQAGLFMEDEEALKASSSEIRDISNSFFLTKSQ